MTNPPKPPKARKGESIRAYSRRTRVSYRQARKALTGKVYETERAQGANLSHGQDRAVRRKVRTQFWLDRWRAEFPQENRTNAEILSGWRRAGYRLPRRGTHGTHAPSEKEAAGMESFLQNFGLTMERARSFVRSRDPRPSDSFYAVDPDTGE